MDQHRSIISACSWRGLPSRRDFLRGLAGAGIGLGAVPRLDGVAARNARKSKGKRQKGKKQRRGQRTPPATGTPPASGPVLTYQCPGPIDDDISADGLVRFAQAFTAERSGSLRQIQFRIQKSTASGDYLVQLLRVVNGKPSLDPNDVLAAIAVPSSAVATGSDVTLAGTFAGPELVAGVEYAAAFSRPGVGPGELAVNTRKSLNGCGGKLFIADGTGPFNEALNQDVLSAVFVA